MHFILERDRDQREREIKDFLRVNYLRMREREDKRVRESERMRDLEEPTYQLIYGLLRFRKMAIDELIKEPNFIYMIVSLHINLFQKK